MYRTESTHVLVSHILCCTLMQAHPQWFTIHLVISVLNTRNIVETSLTSVAGSVGIQSPLQQAKYVDLKPQFTTLLLCWGSRIMV